MWTRPKRASGTLKLALLVIAALVSIEIALSLAWPRIVPRAGFLPKPTEQFWNDGCNDHHRYYERSGPVWGVVEDSATLYCVEK
jgi:hypothetical protein